MAIDPLNKKKASPSVQQVMLPHHRKKTMSALGRTGGLDRIFNLVAIIALVVLMRSVWIVVQMPYVGISLSKSYEVLDVDEGSPAQSLIYPGDIIIALNGTPISELTSPLDDLHPGDIANYTIIRNGQQLEVAIPLEPMPLGKLLAELEPVLVGFVFWISSALIWILSSGPGAKRVFFLLGQIASLMFASGTISTFNNNTPANYLFAASLILLAPTVLHFYLVFPLTKKTFINRYIRYIAYTLAFIISFSYFLRSWLETTPKWISLAGSQEAIYTYISITLLIALISLFTPREKTSISLGRKRRLLVTGMLLSVSPVLLLSVLPLIMSERPLVNFHWTFPFLVLLPTIYAYAVNQENLEKFDRILKQGLSFIIQGAFFISIYFLTVLLLKAISLPAQRAPLLAGIIMTFLAFMVTPFLIKKIDATLERFFYGHWYDYRSIVQQSSHQLSGTINLDEMVKHLCQNIRNMRFKEAAFLWAGDEELSIYCHYGYPDEIAKSFKLKKNSHIANRLMELGRPCSNGDIIWDKDVDDLSPEERVFFSDQRVHIWMPLISGCNELLGVILLGKRQADEALDQTDWAILDTLAEQTSLAAENIKLVEQLRNQLEVMRQMQQELRETKWRLAENREKERMEMARILHDGPIQDIYGVAYQLAIWRKQHGRENDEELHSIETSLMDIENELRSFSTELRPPALETFGLERGIRSHIKKLQEQNPNIEVIPDLIPTKKLISPEKKLALFRIYQESVRNAIRHAQATRIWVKLGTDGNELCLEIKDNGHGFEVPEKWMDFARKGHLGLLGISERAEAIGGQLEVISSPNSGTTIRVKVQLENMKEGEE